MSESRLHEVSQLGQSIWYDNIQRRLITSGDLQRLIDVIVPLVPALRSVNGGQSLLWSMTSIGFPTL